LFKKPEKTCGLSERRLRVDLNDVPFGLIKDGLDLLSPKETIHVLRLPTPLIRALQFLLNLTTNSTDSTPSLTMGGASVTSRF